MTAIVSILNKRAACIAADSAVTFGNGYKIHNSANKIFSLGEKHPVGIMIYGNSYFMQTPWEVIIQMYKDHIKSSPKNCLEFYAQEFIDYLYLKHFFMDNTSINSYIQHFIHYILHKQIQEKAKLKNNSLFEEYKYHKYLFKNVEKCEELITVSFDDFLNITSHTINDIKDEIIASGEYEFEKCQLIEETLYEIIMAKDSIFQSSGIVFAGYGTSDIYPKLMAYRISFPIKHKLRYYCDTHTVINNYGNDASISPFAQTDVINTIISGIDNILLDKFLSFSKKTLEKMYSAIVNELLDENPQILKKIENLNRQKFINELSHKINTHIREEQVIPLLFSIGGLEKSELAEVAESLIALTSVKRKITFNPESVGGPIDVAVISKHEGFQWIKKK